MLNLSYDMTEAEAAKAVAEAAEAFDAIVPHLDWRRYVDLEVLDISHPRWCVLGQVFDNYSDAPEELKAYRAFGAWQSPNNRGLLTKAWAAHLVEWRQRQEPPKRLVEAINRALNYRG